MTLETEFRLRMQLQRLERELYDSLRRADEEACTAHYAKFPSSTWVRLSQSPTPFSSDEALILCQYAENHWLAWVPEYGEITLSANDVVGIY
jgi:hypothetical protein